MNKIKTKVPFYIFKVIAISFIFFVLNLGTEAQIVYSFPTKQNSNVYLKNLTRSTDQFEIKPRFINNGNDVLFLFFTGNPYSPQPWDYILVRSDRNGHTKQPVSSNGVLDFCVMPDEKSALILQVQPSVQLQTTYQKDLTAIQEWELVHLDLNSGEKLHVEPSMGRPLSEGLRKIGKLGLLNVNSTQFLIHSPERKNQILVQRMQSGVMFNFTYCLFDGYKRKSPFFKTEAWKSYSDVNWIPTMIWLSESKLISIHFHSNYNKDFPQSEGLFSIIQIDLMDQASVILHSDIKIKPFPKFALNPLLTHLYFQKSGEEKEITELWRLNLYDKSVEMIYSVKGDIGEIRFSPDGSSFVCTQFQDNNFDVIRIDLDRNHIRRLAGQ